MSISLIKQIRDDRDPRLTAPLKFTLMTVATYHSERNPENGTTVSNRRLADDMGVDIRTVQRHLNTLAIMGKILIADTKHSKRRGKVFVLTTPASRSSDTSVVSEATPVSFASDTHVATRDQGTTDQGKSLNKNPLVAGATSAEENMPFGSLDDDVEMPENGEGSKREWERKRQEDKQERDRQRQEDRRARREKRELRNSTAKKGTMNWLLYRFGAEQRALGIVSGYEKKPLLQTFRVLLEDGYSYEEIEIMIRVFFARNDQYIRSQKPQRDVTRLFISKQHVVKEQAADQIRSHRRGDLPVVRDDEQKAILAQMGMTDA